MPLQFDSSPYLQVWQAQRQRDQEEAQRPQVANQNILQALQMLAESKRQQQLMDIQKQTLANTQRQQALENRYKYGEPIDPGIQVGVPGGTGQSRLFGGLPKGVEGPQVPMQVGQNSSLIDQFNKFRSGGMKSSDARPEFMDALGQDEKKQFYENANPKPLAQYVIPTYDSQGNVTGTTPLPAGTKPFGGGRPAPTPKGSILKTPEAEAAFNLYETARDGLLAGLEGTETGPIIGRIPAFTAEQQIGEGSVAAMAPVLKQLFRVAGEGVFTDRDQALLLQMIPTRTTRPEARASQIQNIDNIVRAKLRMAPEQSAEASEGIPQIGQSFQGGTVKTIRRVR